MLDEHLLEGIYKAKQFNVTMVEADTIGKITEKEKFRAAKQILFGLAVLYVLTLLSYLLRPHEGARLLDIATVTFPPLATLILASYFKDKHH